MAVFGRREGPARLCCHRAGECPEWQRELTVNQPSYDFEGSSPSSPTTLRPDGLRVAQPRKTVRAKRVRRSLSEAKAWTDRRRILWAKADARFASYGLASHAAIINGKDSRKADAALAFN